MVEFVQVSTTVNSYKSARRIAEALLANGSAGCVQILGPVKSIYRWKGRIEHEAEWLCLIKARTSAYPRVESTIKQLHNYENPEIVALPILRGNPEYLRWMRKETAGKRNTSAS